MEWNTTQQRKRNKLNMCDNTWMHHKSITNDATMKNLYYIHHSASYSYQRGITGSKGMRVCNFDVSKLPSSGAVPMYICGSAPISLQPHQKYIEIRIFVHLTGNLHPGII